jgi:hypothetical protein
MIFDTENFKKEFETKKKIADALEEMFTPMFEEYAAGRCLLLSRKIVNKVDDLIDPKELFENEEKGKRVELLFEQLNALIDQFIKDEENKND